MHIVDIMKHHKAVETLLGVSQQERRCAFGRTKAERSALERRASAQELERVFPGLFVKPDFWKSLNPAEKSAHIARTLGLRHGHWVFAGLTAANLHGLEHQWLLHDGTITIATHTQGSDTGNGRIRRLFIPKSQQTDIRHIDGVAVTSEARTVVDCALTLEFRYALPIVDSALRRGVAINDIIGICASMQRDCTAALRLLHYADPTSENGGESLTRGTILEGGYKIPELQQTIIDPQTGMAYRVDFLWRLEDGRMIVGEYDGTRKYVDPEMTDNKGVREVVADERIREEGLKRGGVSAIVRFGFDEVMKRTPLLHKLRMAGIPLRS